MLSYNSSITLPRGPASVLVVGGFHVLVFWALLHALEVGTDGRVMDAKVAQSSGFPRLDEAAVKEARSHWRLRPAMRNGVPFEQWLTLGVVFRLENQ